MECEADNAHEYPWIVLGACRPCLGQAWASCICWSNHWLILRDSRSTCVIIKKRTVSQAWWGQTLIPVYRVNWLIRCLWIVRQKERKEVEHIKSKNRTRDDRVLVAILFHWESVVRRGWSPVTLTQATRVQATKKNGINRLPCGYVYRSSHWIGKSTSGLHPFCRHRGVRLSVVHVFNSWVVFELTHDTKRVKIRAGSDLW